MLDVNEDWYELKLLEDEVSWALEDQHFCFVLNAIEWHDRGWKYHIYHVYMLNMKRAKIQDRSW